MNSLQTCSALQKAAQRISSILDLDQLIDSVVNGSYRSSVWVSGSLHLSAR